MGDTKMKTNTLKFRTNLIGFVLIALVLGFVQESLACECRVGSLIFLGTDETTGEVQVEYQSTILSPTTERGCLNLAREIACGYGNEVDVTCGHVDTGFYPGYGDCDLIAN
jgi:hypothetical protein